jgi:hypothetical protein
MEDLNLVDDSFELWHNSEGERALYNKIVKTYPSEDNMFDVLNFEGEENSSTEQKTTEKQKLDLDKLGESIVTTAGAVGSVATSVQAFKGDGTKKAQRLAVKDVCGKKPTAFSKKARKEEYKKCITDYQAKKMAMLDAQTKKSEEVVIKSDETKTGMSTTTKVLIGVGVLALIGGVIYFVRRGASAK